MHPLTHAITLICPVLLPHNLPSSLPLSMSVWWLRQQPSALRYNRLSSPPGRRKKKGAYIRIVLIRHRQSRGSLSFANAAFLTEQTAEHFKVCGARIMYAGGRAICPALLSLSYTRDCLYQWLVLLGSFFSLADAAHRAYVWADCYMNIFTYVHTHVCCSKNVFQR